MTLSCVPRSDNTVRDTRLIKRDHYGCKKREETEFFENRRGRDCHRVWKKKRCPRCAPEHDSDGEKKKGTVERDRRLPEQVSTYSLLIKFSLI